MKILAIETSCDETAVSIVESTGDFPNATYAVLGNALFSQVDIHREYGGVFPNVAKREHTKTLVPMLKMALTEARVQETKTEISPELEAELKTILSREGDLAAALIPYLKTIEKPDIDLIAVTHGPGLEPALWVGVSFAKALSKAWEVPVVPTNHMEGHVVSSLFSKDRLRPVSFPAVSLLISGGHTELILMKDWGTYELIGKTKDDAVGEAFDKVARMLGLPYPGGPEISKLAHTSRTSGTPHTYALPRPMIKSNDCDFSFSGLKTAVLYTVKDQELTEEQKTQLAQEFEDAVAEVLVSKTLKAVDDTGAQTVIIGGGVSANKHIRSEMEKAFTEQRPDVTCYFPEATLATDNAIMIALAAHQKYAIFGEKAVDRENEFVAEGNLLIHS